MSINNFNIKANEVNTAIAADRSVPAQESVKQDFYKESLQHLFSIQCKLSIGAVNDPLEKEADTMADKVMSMQEVPSVIESSAGGIQRTCADCGKGDKLQRKTLASFIQRKESTTGDAAASDAISNKINASKGSGSNFDTYTQSFMQSRFGTDFNNVKIHTDEESIQMNRELNAKAFTVCSDIYFNSGKYNPDSSTGRHLLAHELTHTIQQEKKDQSINRQSIDIINIPLKEAQDLLNETPTTTKDRGAWMLKAEAQGFVNFNTTAAKQNVQDIKDEKKVQNLDPKDLGYDVPILEIEIGLVKKLAHRWVDAEGIGTKSSIQFGSMIRSDSKDVHGQGKAIDINNLNMVASVTAAEQILSDLDATIHSSYGLGMPFQGDFFDPNDEIGAKQKAAQVAAGKEDKTVNVVDSIVKFSAHIYKSTGTKGDDGAWTWEKKPTVQENFGAYKHLKSQLLKDKLAARRKDGITFMIFPDNDNHLHLDIR